MKKKHTLEKKKERKEKPKRSLKHINMFNLLGPEQGRRRQGWKGGMQLNLLIFEFNLFGVILIIFLYRTCCCSMSAACSQGDVWRPPEVVNCLGPSMNGLHVRVLFDSKGVNPRYRRKRADVKRIRTKISLGK